MTTTVEIVFLESKPGYYDKGQLKAVKAGYFNNYLKPKGIAQLRSLVDLSLFSSLQKHYDTKQAELKAKADDYAKTLSNATFVLTAKCQDRGTLYGSVSTKDVISLIKKKGQYDLTPEHIFLSKKNIKEIGQYSFSIRLHADTPIFCTLSVLPEESKKSKKVATPLKKISRPVGQSPNKDVSASITATKDAEKSDSTDDDLVSKDSE
ncbi:MAG: 50S ribosomal protein L9 [bacterium]